VIKIADYGPWTLTLGSDREHQLQMLQAEVYKEIQKLFSEKNCLAFMNRCDEFFVVTNGMNLDDHIEIQKELEKFSKIKLHVTIGFGQTPFESNLKAYEGRNSKIVLNQEHNIYGFVDGHTEQNVTILHIDVEDLTSSQKTKSPYEISSLIFQIYSRMSQFFLDQKYLTFFMGGDNFMIIADENAKKVAREFIDNIKNDLGITLNCGVGRAKTAREAVSLATKSLDMIREIRNSGKEKPDIYEIPCC
jgi:GTP cyclohydrolase IIa